MMVWPTTSKKEEDKAREFRSVYLRNQATNLETLGAVASACGIRLNGLEEKARPPNLRGYHEVYNGKKNIYYCLATASAVSRTPFCMNSRR